jgi:hypothetical protein
MIDSVRAYLLERYFSTGIASNNQMIPPHLSQQPQWSSGARRPLWAWLMSVLLHLFVLTTIGLVAQRPPAVTGAAVEPDRPVSVAWVHRRVEQDEAAWQADAGPVDPNPQPPPLNAPQPAASSASAASSSPADGLPPPPDFAPPLDLTAVLAEMTAAVGPQRSAGSVAAELDGDALLGASGEGRAGMGDRGLGMAAGGSAGTASLFGISGSGSRLVYVVDRSDSMNSFGGRPWRAAKTELKRSLATLAPSQSFQLVLYNDQPRPYRAGTAGPLVQMLRGEADLISGAQRYLDSAQAFGGTDHATALRLSLRMAPDLLFFLTDGHIPSLSGQELAEVRALAQRSGTVIHAIEFGTEPSPHPNTFVRALAEQNGGEYRYFDVRQFSQAGMWQSEAP